VGDRPQLAPRLAELGVRTIDDLARHPPHLLEAAFGVIGPQLREAAQGHDETPLVPYHQGVAPSRWATRSRCPGTRGTRGLEGTLLKLADQVARRLRSEGYVGRTVSLKLRDHRFVTHQRQRSRPVPTADHAAIFALARELWHELWTASRCGCWDHGGGTLARAGVRPGRAVHDRRARRALREALDRVRDRLGEASVVPAGALAHRHALGHVPFGALRPGRGGERAGAADAPSHRGRHAARDSGDERRAGIRVPLGSRRDPVGTSGYSFADWVGPFYPPGCGPPTSCRSTRVSSRCGGQHHLLRDPGALAARPDGGPHARRIPVRGQAPPVDDPRARARSGRDRQLSGALRPLKEARRYDGLLAQFPWRFRRTKENRRHLAALRERLEGEPLFVEFRHDSWLTPELEPSLKQHRIGFCAVDEPELPGLLPRIAPLTTEDAYIRFHGRNAATWYGGDRNLRYDYSYTREELSEWLRRIGELAEQARRVYLFFNNCHAGQAARSAKLMQDLLREQGLLRPRG